MWKVNLLRYVWGVCFASISGPRFLVSIFTTYGGIDSYGSHSGHEAPPSRSAFSFDGNIIRSSVLELNSLQSGR